MSEPASYRPLDAGTLPHGVAFAASRARFILRGDRDVMSAAGNALGVTPAREACRAARGADWSALWLGPDEQLLLGPADRLAIVESALATALASYPHSLVDISHRQIGLTVSGPGCELLLAAGCPLDLDRSAFPIDMATRTVYAKTEIVLWRTAAEQFHIEVWRSYATYLVGLLREAAADVTT